MLSPAPATSMRTWNSATKLGLVRAGDAQNGFKDVNIIAQGSLTRGNVRGTLPAAPAATSMSGRATST